MLYKRLHKCPKFAFTLIIIQMLSWILTFIWINTCFVVWTVCCQLLSYVPSFWVYYMKFKYISLRFVVITKDLKAFLHFSNMCNTAKYKKTHKCCAYFRAIIGSRIVSPMIPNCCNLWILILFFYNNTTAIL